MQSKAFDMSGRRAPNASLYLLILYISQSELKDCVENYILYEIHIGKSLSLNYS